MSDKMTPIKLNQLKKASEAYAELRTLHTDPLTDEVDGNFPAWSIFRDDFIADWTSNRTIVDEKEADAMFDTLVETAIQEIETAEANAAAEVVETPTPAVVNNVDPSVGMGDVAAPKRRGRPPGSAKTAETTETAPKAKKSYYVPVALRNAKKTAKVKKVTKTKKVAAKKKSAGGGKMDLARVTVEKFSAKGWSRKDIIARLVEVNGLSPAYAATAYQKLK